LLKVIVVLSILGSVVQSATVFRTEDPNCDYHDSSDREFFTTYSNTTCTPFGTAGNLAYTLSCSSSSRRSSWTVSVWSSASCAGTITATTSGSGIGCSAINGEPEGRHWIVDCSDVDSQFCEANIAQVCLDHRTNMADCTADENCRWCPTTGACQYFNPLASCQVADTHINPNLYWQFPNIGQCGFQVCNITHSDCLFQSSSTCSDRSGYGCHACTIQVSIISLSLCYPSFAEPCRYNEDFVMNSPFSCPVYSPINAAASLTPSSVIVLLAALIIATKL